MSNENSIRLSNFIPLSNLRFEFTEDQDTGVKHLYLEGIAHGFEANLKHIKIRQGATRKAVRRFNAEQKAGRIHQVWIDHAYINPSFLGNPTPSQYVIGHVDEYGFKEKEGARFKMDINPDHPTQIHKAILRQDIDGVSIGADVKKENLYCSIDDKNIFSDECEHTIGEKLENGETVGMEVDDYSLDELTVTAKQADPDAKIRFSELSNNKMDSSITFSLDTYDKNRELIEKGINFQKDKGESLKKIKKYDRVDTNMTEQASVDNDKSIESAVSLEKFNQLVDAVDNMKQSMETNSNALVSYLQVQEQEKADTLLTQKREIVVKIMAKSKEFSEEELLKLELNYLNKLEKAIVPIVEAELNQTFGTAHVPKDDEDAKNKLELSRDDIKTWMRLKMGFKTPKAPKHIRAKVKARLNGESINGDDTFLQYLLDKEKEK